MDRNPDADALFGRDPARPADRPGAPATGRANVDERTLYGDEALPGDSEMFRPSAALRPALLARVDELRDAGFSSAELVQRHRGFVSMVTTAAVPLALAERLYAWDTDQVLRAASHDDTSTADGEGWFEQSRRDARGLYGVERAEKCLGMVEHFLGQHTALRDRLEATGHRHDPEIVEQLIEHVRRLHEG